MGFEARGARIGKYTVLDVIGDGGMAAVYRAQIEGLARARKDVALKVIHSHLCADRDFVLMFLDEMRMGMSLSHRNIVQTFDVGRTEDHYYMAMELLDGGSLRQLMDSCAPGEVLPLEVTLFVGMEVCTALSYAHGLTDAGNGAQQGVIHRDVSPSNVLLSREGDVKLADFGVAKAAGRMAVSAAHVVKGKLRYIAPEQARGQSEARSDLFSLGVVLYELLSGDRFRDAMSLTAVLSGRDGGDLASARYRTRMTQRSVSEPLISAVMACLSTDVRGRPASADALREVLAQELFARELSRGGRVDLHRMLRDLINARGVARFAPPDAVAGRPLEDRVASALLRQAQDLSAKSLAQSELAQSGTIPTLIADDGAGSGAQPFIDAVTTADESLAEVRGDAVTALARAAMDAPPAAPVDEALPVARPTEAPASAPARHRAPDATDGSITALPRNRVQLGGSAFIAAALIGALLVWLVRLVHDQRHAEPAGPAAAVDAHEARRPGDASASSNLVAVHARRAPDAAFRTPAATTPDARLAAPELPHHPPLLPTRPSTKRTHRLVPHLAAAGTLAVNTFPWCKVYLDGQFIGNTPIEGQKLSAGQHRVRLVNPTRNLSVRRTVQIAPGRRFVLTVNLATESP